MAVKALIIVESPAKTRTIKNFLGQQYEVMASMGHVRDLPENGLGVDIEHAFKPEYLVIKDKTDILSKLRKAAQQADEVYLATDPDREGEAIAWHLSEALHLKDARRIEFNEITKTAIISALEHPRDIDMPRVNAQQARRVLDRLVGYQLSPLLWRKVRRGLSAGRVQSVAVKLICDREREILAFLPEEYWTIAADLAKHAEPQLTFTAKLTEQHDKKLKITNGEQAHAAEAALQQAAYRVAEVKRSKQQRTPPPPFITSTLQQEAGFSPKRTMALAQQLYEGLEMGDEGHVGLITYMRTDSTRVAVEAQEQAASYITQEYGKEYLPESARKIKAVKGAQEAHEAIRPTDVTRTPESLASRLTAEQLKLYRLIWRRFLASQMANAVLDVMVVDVQAGEYTLRATGQRVHFPGYLVLAGERPEAEFLPPMEKGDALDLLQLHTEQNFTQPPPRFTEATLVKALEARGIGRPSTYAQITSTIQDRRYAFLEEKKFHPTGLGMVVTEQLEKHFPTIIDPDFTAHVEGELDAVESGTEDWVGLLEKFYGPFEHALTEAAEKMERIKVPEVELESTCPQCGKPLVLREGRFGRFVACSGFPECTFSAQEEQFVQKTDENGDESAPAEEQQHAPCDLCGEPMIVRRSRRGPFLGCSRYPECTFTRPMPGDEKSARPPKQPVQLTNIACDKCGKPMALRTSRRGPFLGCSSYPRCKNAKPLPEGEVEIVATGAPAAADAPAKTPRKSTSKKAETTGKTETKSKTETTSKTGTKKAKKTT